MVDKDVAWSAVKSNEIPLFPLSRWYVGRYVADTSDVQKHSRPFLFPVIPLQQCLVEIRDQWGALPTYGHIGQAEVTHCGDAALICYDRRVPNLQGGRDLIAVETLRRWHVMNRLSVRTNESHLPHLQPSRPCNSLRCLCEQLPKKDVVAAQFANSAIAAYSHQVPFETDRIRVRQETDQCPARNGLAAVQVTNCCDFQQARVDTVHARTGH